MNPRAWKRREGVAVALGVLAVALGVAGLTPPDATQAPQHDDAQPFDLVCIVGGEVVSTHHVGLVHAAQDGDAWTVTYADGRLRVYLQRRGEACGIEAPQDATPAETSPPQNQELPHA